MAGRVDEVAAHAGERGRVAHCYRMLGSITEAEHVAARTTSLATATLECLARAAERPLPTDLGEPSDHPEGELHQRPEVTWLEPIPDEFGDGRPIGLDLIAALQRLPARHRAALVLTDIEGWSPSQVSAAIGSIDIEEARSLFKPLPGHAADQGELLDRYREAFEQYDVPSIVQFFTDDAIWEMPPFTSWFRGARNIGRLISTHCPAEKPGDQVLIPIKANGQPGFAVYMRDPADNVHRAFQLQVLTLTAAGIIHAVAFFDTTLFDAFNLPDLLAGLPPHLYDGSPRPHVERLHRP